MATRTYNSYSTVSNLNGEALRHCSHITVVALWGKNVNVLAIVSTITVLKTVLLHVMFCLSL